MDKIKDRGWNFLLHDGADHFYIEKLVRTFYKNIMNANLELERTTVNWEFEDMEIDLEDIARVIGTPVRGHIKLDL